MIGMIAAVSKNGVIGSVNEAGKQIIPFHYPADFKHFKATTLNSVVIMGRKTWETLGKPLPHRTNVVITHSYLNLPDVHTETSLSEAIAKYSSSSIWLIGGAGIYQEGMQYCDIILLTITPDIITGDNLVRFPFINPLQYKAEEIATMEGDNKLLLVKYYKVY